MRLALFLAQIFGMVSPKMMMTTVMISVPSQVSLSLPLSRSTSTEVSEEAPMLARLLPMRMVLSASSKCSAMRRATPARFEPSSFSFSRRMLLQEE